MCARLIAALAALCLSATAGQALQSAADLEKAGWQAVRAGKVNDASDAFREALRLEPRNAGVLLGAALSAHLLGRSEDARQHLVAALQSQP
jgi:Flp pilus assembly protein TadD